MRKIAHITDLHLDEPFPIQHGVNARENWKQILEDVVMRDISEIVFTGDIGTTASHKWFFETLEATGLPYQLILGNHDVFSTTVRDYHPDIPANQEELFYQYEDEYFKYLFLDTSADQLSDTQFDWLRAALKTDKNVVLFVHHPVLETHAASQRDFPLLGSEKIKAGLHQHTQQVFVFCGHLHFEDERSEKNIHQFITPASCYQGSRSPEKFGLENINYGYRILELGQNQVSSSVVMFSPAQ